MIDIEKTREELQRKGVKSELIKIDALLTYDEKGFVTGVKYPDKAGFLGKPLKKQIW